MVSPETLHTNNKNWLSRVVYIFEQIHIYVTIIKKKRISTWGGVGGPGGRVRGRYWREDRKGGK